MIRDLENGTRVVELGLGTTMVGLIQYNEEDESGTICFSNQPIENGKLKGDEVLIHVANANGVFSYFQAIVDMLKTWNLTGTDSEVEFVKKQLESLGETLQQKREATIHEQTEGT